MRTAGRTIGDGAPPLRDILAVGLATFVVGASFGAVAVAAELPGWAVVALSVLLYAGGAQFTAVGLVAAGSPAVAILAGLLLNARHLPFGLALADTLAGRWGTRLLGSHLLTDEATAFALAAPAGPARRRTFWRTGVVLFVTWNVGTLLGLLLGTAAGDPARFGVDAAFPAGLLALLLPALRAPATRRVAVVGAGVAVLTSALLPPGLPVLLSLSALILLVKLPGSAGIGPKRPEDAGPGRPGDAGSGRPEDAGSGPPDGTGPERRTGEEAACSSP